MVRTAGGQNWPWYLREKVGVAEAYAYMTFPKAACPAVSCYMEAVPDMTKFLNFSNDILSYAPLLPSSDLMVGIGGLL